MVSLGPRKTLSLSASVVPTTYDKDLKNGYDTNTCHHCCIDNISQVSLGMSGLASMVSLGPRKSLALSASEVSMTYDKDLKKRLQHKYMPSLSHRQHFTSFSRLRGLQLPWCPFGLKRGQHSKRIDLNHESDYEGDLWSSQGRPPNRVVPKKEERHQFVSVRPTQSTTPDILLTSESSW